MRKHNEPSLEAERDALREEVARLNQETRRRQMELDILKKAEEIIKKTRHQYQSPEQQRKNKDR